MKIDLDNDFEYKDKGPKHFVFIFLIVLFIGIIVGTILITLTNYSYGY